MIYTIEAKGNIYLSLMQQYFGLGSADMNREISFLHDDLLRVLKLKGINYQELKNALIPTKDRKEALLVFDASRIESGFYGGLVMDEVLECLSEFSTHSVLAGDFINIIDNPSFNPLNLIKDHILLPKHTRYCSEYFLVYINNLSPSQFNNVERYFDEIDYFVGCIDVTYTSALKDYCSYILGTSYIKHGNTIISVHEDDRDETEDINIRHYPFEKHGYKVRSLPESLFNIFLNYKIESNVTGVDTTDVGISIQSISHEYEGLDDFIVYIDERKLDYLRSNKDGTLKKLGGIDIDKDELERIILSHIKTSYVFNLEYMSEFNVSKFNIIFEVKDKEDRPHKVLAALEYMFSEKKLRLLTLF